MMAAPLTWKPGPQRNYEEIDVAQALQKTIE